MFCSWSRPRSTSWGGGAEGLDELAQVQLVAGQHLAGGPEVLAFQRLAQAGQIVQQGGQRGGRHQRAPA